MHPSLIIGITGASGAIYGLRLLEALQGAGVTTHLIVSRAGQMTLAHETGYSLAQAQALATHAHAAGDISACIASGSHPALGMIIAPCSMRSLGEIATGCTSSLLTRAADVTLKERRRLVLMVRETPLHLGHLRNMAQVTEMGGIIAPPVPAFYAKPQTVDDIVNHTVGRVLDLFDIRHSLAKRWEGMKKPGVND